MTTMLMNIYEKLMAHYGHPHWWPADTPYEVIAGAILTQNTSWSNVEKALGNFGGRLSPEFVMEAGLDELQDIIRPAGFFNQKAAYLKDVTLWFAKYGCDVENIRRQPLDAVRRELLSVKGVGPETADSILLYAAGLPSFVVDAYTRRMCGRCALPAGNSYAEIKAYFESSLPRDAELFNNYHALIVTNAKEHCRKTPACQGCPLTQECREVR